MKSLVTPSTTNPEVLIHLDQNETGKPRSVDQLVQHRRYLHLREQIRAHLDTLGTPEAEPGIGSGWTQFLDGTRGAGKSTFLHSAMAALEADVEIGKRLAFVSLIDPSRIEQNEIILLVILQQLRKRVEDCLNGRRRTEDEGWRDEWRQAFRSVAGGLSLFAKGFHPLDDLDPELFLDWGLERAGDGISLRKNLQRLFATACKILGTRALMLAFDDADTDSRLTIDLLECIRKYLDTPLIMVVVTGDLELYSLLVRQHFAQTVAGKREAALDLQRRSVGGDRSPQYLRMIDHLEEQYLLKLFPIDRRTQLQPLWNVIRTANYFATHPIWESEPRTLIDVVNEIVRQGLRVKKEADVANYAEFLLKQPLRSVLQVMAHCAPHLTNFSNDKAAIWSATLTAALSRALEGLALTSLYKYSIDTDELAARELPTLIRAVFSLSLQDGDIDTAPYLRPMSAERDIKACFAALAAQVPNICSEQPGTALRYLLRGPGSVSLFSLARHHPGVKELTFQDKIHRFESYMGIGRKEDGLDWARRATAVIALPFGTNPKARVVLPGVVGLSRKRRAQEQTARAAIQLAVSSEGIKRMPVFALGMVHVASATDMRTYGSIFVLVGLIEKLLSASSDQEAKQVFDSAYPALTVSAPDWLQQGALEDSQDTKSVKSDSTDSASSIHQSLWNSVQKWRDHALSLAKDVVPSAIFLGKVWTRLFFSLENAADELKTRHKFGDVMEMFALCVINAFLIEEADHHLRGASPALDISMSRSNPRTSPDTFIKKLNSMQLNRSALPLTSIISTCPLILGLLDDEIGYGQALKAFFPDDADDASIKAQLRPKAIGQLMATVSVTGEARTRLTTASRAKPDSSKTSELQGTDGEVDA